MEDTTWSEEKVLHFIKLNLLLWRLELEDTGLKLEDIADDEPLLSDDGLALDSVDALDLLVGVEKAFGLQLKNIDKPFIEKTCRSVRTLAQFVLENVAVAKSA